LATPRAVRIPRPKVSAGAPESSSPAPFGPAAIPPPPVAPRADVRWNQAANERARRLLVVYLGALLVLYLGFLFLDRAAPGGTSSTAETGMLYFTLIAVVLGIGGVWVALAPVPRRLEITSAGVVVVEAWGRRREFPPIAEIRPIVVRRFPRGFLSSRAVETLEVTDRSGHRRTYQLEQGLLPVPASDVR
jgi:hypothetical protein